MENIIQTVIILGYWVIFNQTINLYCAEDQSSTYIKDFKCYSVKVVSKYYLRSVRIRKRR